MKTVTGEGMKLEDKARLADLFLGFRGKVGAEIESLYAQVKDFIGDDHDPFPRVSYMALYEASKIKIGRLMRELAELKAGKPGTYACHVCFRAYPHQEELHKSEAEILVHLPDLGPMDGDVPSGRMEA